MKNELAIERKTLKRLPEAYRDKTKAIEISKQLDEMTYRNQTLVKAEKFDDLLIV